MERTFVYHKPMPENGSKQRILNAAVRAARTAGLENLTIGDLAAMVGMSKAGLFAHFGSKEGLQLATLEHASKEFVRKVVTPSSVAERGLPRLWSLLEHWLRDMEESREAGGCFFCAAAADVDGRPGAVRDRLVRISAQWLDLLRRQAVIAVERGHLDASTDVELLVFQLHALGLQANWAAQLLNDAEAFDTARRVIRLRLDAASTVDARSDAPAS